MKRLFLFALLIISLTGCSTLQDLLPAQQATQPPAAPTDTLVVLPSELPTSTPNLFDVVTLTPSPSPIFPTATPASTDTPTPRPTITLEYINPLFFTPSLSMFSFVQKSGSQIMWNLCGPSSIKFNVTVTNPLKVYYVLMFMRLQDKYSANGTEWGGGAIMNDNDRGTFFYTVTTDNINHYRDFEDAWLQYQFVATTKYLKVLGRSQIYNSDVSVTHCPKTPKP